MNGARNSNANVRNPNKKTKAGRGFIAIRL